MTCAIRAGLRRGMIELRQSFTNGAELSSHLFWPLLMLGSLWFMRDAEFGSTGLLLGTFALPSILGMNASFGMVTMGQLLTAEREDGTLLRAKATPNGMVGYLVGKVVSVSRWTAGRPGDLPDPRAVPHRGARPRCGRVAGPCLGGGARHGGHLGPVLKVDLGL